MPEEHLLFQKRGGELSVEVWRNKDGHRRIGLIRSYEENGEWKITNRLGHANQHRGALLLKAARDWINAEDKQEGEKREAEKQKKASPKNRRNFVR